MKSFLLLLASFALFFLTSNAQDLIITGALDGALTGGKPKAVELYAVNDIPDLSIYGLESANNGAAADTVEFGFPADAIDAGEFIYVTAHATEFGTWFGFDADYTSGVVNVNGDDAVLLYKNGAIVDALGNVGEQPSAGQLWNYADGWIYRNDNTGPNSSFSMGDWTVEANALDGSMTNDEAGDDKFPAETYERFVDTGFKRNAALVASKIYPNPSKNGTFNVSFSSGHKGLSVKVFNLVGDEVYREEIPMNISSKAIRLENLSNGTYFLQITDSFKNKESHRLLKW